MTDAWKQQVGQLIDGRLRLIQYLGGSDHSAVFLTEFGDRRQRFVIKLIGADPDDADTQLARLRRAAKLSHPHLARVFETGRAEVGSARVVYVVTEYADEDVSLILPDRALTPDEVREMLPQIIDALQYLHSQGFVHARLKPSNILAVDDQLKLSIDGVCTPHERAASGEKPSAYDPPELAPTGPSPAGDVWSLGMMLVEVLTQRLPVWEWTGHADPPAPRTLPAPFLEIARNCLRRAPEMRCTLREISMNLDPQAAARAALARSGASNTSLPLPHAVADDRFLSDRGLSSDIAHTLSKGLQPLRSRISSSAAGDAPASGSPAGRSKSRYAVQAAAFVLALAAVIAIPRYFRHAPKSLDSDPVAAAPASENPAPATMAEAGSDPKPASNSASEPDLKPEVAAVSKSSAKPSAPETKASKPIPRAPIASSDSAADAPRPAQPPLSPAAAILRGQVVHSVQPDVTERARATIRGKVRVSVKVTVDSTGKVSEAAFEAPGPSKYFADAAIRAAKSWTFAPAKSNGASVTSQWLLRFEFDNAATKAFSAEIYP